jgi:hypothetical protein
VCSTWAQATGTDATGLELRRVVIPAPPDG